MENKYTTDEFLLIYNEREKKLMEEYKTLTVETARKRFSDLFIDCPIELHIDPFGLMRMLENHFPDFYNSSNKRVYTINVDELSKYNVQDYLDNIKKRFFLPEK